MALSAVALLAVACSSPSASQPTDSNGGGGGGATPTPDGGGATATPDNGGGGGGGGGGANGSITYEITGDYEDSGEVPFQPLISNWIESEGGWLANFVMEDGEGAYVQMNTATSGAGQILNFGDGTVLISAVSDPSTGFDCTFTFTKNDSTGLAGSMECNDIIGANLTSGAQLTVDISAEWDAHP
jgi:hypothetical protein